MKIVVSSFNLLDAIHAKINNQTISNKSWRKLETIRDRFLGTGKGLMVNGLTHRDVVNMQAGKVNKSSVCLSAYLTQIRQGRALIFISPNLKAKACRDLLNKLDDWEKKAVAEEKMLRRKLDKLARGPYLDLQRNLIETVLYGEPVRDPSAPSASEHTQDCLYCAQVIPRKTRR